MKKFLSSLSLVVLIILLIKGTIGTGDILGALSIFKMQNIDRGLKKISEVGSVITDDSTSGIDKAFNIGKKIIGGTADGYYKNLKSLTKTVGKDLKSGKPYTREEWDDRVKKVNGKSLRMYTMEKSIWNHSKGKDFKYECPYTGEIITNVRKIDRDHIIPLAYAHNHGGANWPKEKKTEYTYDEEVSVNTSASANRIKGAKGPSEYMPEKHKAEYCYTWLYIANKYGIAIAKEDMAVIKKYVKPGKKYNRINLDKKDLK